MTWAEQENQLMTSVYEGAQMIRISHTKALASLIEKSSHAAGHQQPRKEQAHSVGPSRQVDLHVLQHLKGPCIYCVSAQAL